MPQTLEQLIADHTGQPGALLVVAEKLMAQYRSIPTKALTLLQQHLGLAATEIQSVLSFYHYPVTDAPVLCQVEVCLALTCHLRQAEPLLQHLCHEFSLVANQVSEDGRLLIATMNCLSDCDRAPAVRINGEFVMATDVETLVQHIKQVLV